MDFAEKQLVKYGWVKGKLLMTSCLAIHVLKVDLPYWHYLMLKNKNSFQAFNI